MTFVTSETDQSRSLLQGEEVRFVPRVPPRDWRTATRALPTALGLIRREQVTDVISTGSAIAVPYLLGARLARREAHYIESAARTDGPSVAGQILRRIPGMRLYTQYPRWADDQWSYRGSVFDGFVARPSDAERAAPRRVVVTLGTLNQYPFDRAVQAVRRVLTQLGDEDVHVLWQIGEAQAEGLSGEVRATVPADRLRVAIAQADLVIAHAGTGSALQILDAGRIPLFLPRSSARGEHIDDHQLLIAAELEGRGLAVTADPDDLSVEHVRKALSARVEHRSATDFHLKPQKVEVPAHGTGLDRRSDLSASTLPR
ncbi:glycosyltransferase [Ornithinimicrobium sufpigmenti]|uniref:glycosyltransferase n=1 Tax=Ornithinimicrobium sufpigmenti TaxID=2508882 RepID=UPI0015E17C35|nr:MULTISPECIES: glycosyltransferase [unclassified Ornithinimicrobium]